MTQLLTSRHFRLLLLLLVLLSALAYAFRLESIVWHLWDAQQHSDGTESRLKDYVVEHEAVEIPGVGTDLSDLSYNHETHTLFTISNKQPLVVELSLEGKVLRTVHVKGIGDMEGIAHVSGNRFVLLDEAKQSLVMADIKDGEDEVDVSNAPTLTLAMYADDNKGFEGVTWDRERQRLLVAKERSPKRVIAVQGFVDAKPDHPTAIHIEKLPETASSGLRDLSAVSYDADTGHILLLSDDSRMVAKYDASGKRLDTLSLWRGFQGLSRTVPQAEGLAIGPDKRIYVISEPNLFYVFKPKPDSET